MFTQITILEIMANVFAASVAFSLILFLVYTKDLRIAKQESMSQMKSDLNMIHSVNRSQKGQQYVYDLLQKYTASKDKIDRNNKQWNDNLFEQSMWVIFLLFVLFVGFSMHAVSNQTINSAFALNMLVVSVAVTSVFNLLAYWLLKPQKTDNVSFYRKLLTEFLSQKMTSTNEYCKHRTK